MVYMGQIGVVEIAAALSKKVRMNEISEDDYQSAVLLFLIDVRNEEYFLLPLSDQIIESAVNLTRKYPLRAYDAVHLANAVVLNTTLLEANLPSLVFVASDRILCKAAQDEGLSNINPDEM